MENKKVHGIISIILCFIGSLVFVLQVYGHEVEPVLQFLLYAGIGIGLFGNLMSYLTACIIRHRFKKHCMAIMFFVFTNMVLIGVYWYIAFVIYLVS